MRFKYSLARRPIKYFTVRLSVSTLEVLTVHFFQAPASHLTALTYKDRGADNFVWPGGLFVRISVYNSIQP